METIMGIVPENPNRQYKDGVFRMLFKGGKNFLKLGGALTGRDYAPDAPMVDTTLSNVLYYSWKNDISYLINDEALLFVEHQSTVCGNIAARMNIYQGVVSSRLWAGREEMHGRRKMRFPTPHFAVIYNGIEETEPVRVERLSSLYGAQGEKYPPPLDLEVVIYNINNGYNQELLSRCEPLRQYQIFIETVRKHEKRHELGKAIALAIDECIKNDVLAEFLTLNGQEIRGMLFKEMTDTERYELFKRDYSEEVMERGIATGIEEERRRSARAMRNEGMAPETIARITGLTIDDILRL